MTEAVRRENLFKAPAINRVFTNQYQVAGMYSDNSMRAYQIRLEQIKQAELKTKKHLLKH
jgi:hypothetical protein